jgi:hypothetical protein
MAKASNASSKPLCVAAKKNIEQNGVATNDAPMNFLMLQPPLPVGFVANRVLQARPSQACGILLIFPCATGLAPAASSL